MASVAPRLLLAFSALLLVVGGAMHAIAYRRAAAAVASSSLQPFFGQSSLALWLGDSTTNGVLAIVFCLIALRPANASGLVVVFLALIPAAVAILIYRHLGGFFAGHLLLAAAVAAFVAGLLDFRP